MDGYAVFDETGNIIPVTLTATWLVENTAVPIAMRDAVLRFLDKNPQYGVCWERAVADGYTVRKVHINMEIA